MKRVALYYRVSTGDQTTEPQRIELMEYFNRRWCPSVSEDWVAGEYSDRISGAKWSRTGLDRLMADVRARRVNVVICVKMDRLGRSLPHLAQMISEFDANGVALVCTSQGIDTSLDNPAGRLQMHVLMAVADFERSLIKERTRAGLEAARARGSRLGRPEKPLSEERRRLIEEFSSGPGMTYRELAGKMGCSIGRAHALVKEAR